MQEKYVKILVKFSDQKVPIFFPFLPFFNPLSPSYLGESKISFSSIRAVPKKHVLAYLPSTAIPQNFPSCFSVYLNAFAHICLIFTHYIALLLIFTNDQNKISIKNETNSIDNFNTCF